MAEIILLCEKALNAADRLNAEIGAKAWGTYERVPFTHNLKKAISGLEEISSALELMKAEFAREGIPQSADVEAHLHEINSAIMLLKRNREMEDSKGETADAEGNAELYSSLEQKVLSALLKTRYLAERAGIATRKREGSPMRGRSAHRNVLELLEKKEDELQDIRGKYEELRRKSYFGTLEENTSADIEKELNSLGRGLEAAGSMLGTEIEGQRKQLEDLIRGYDILEHRMRAIDEMNGQHMAKTFELITLLKKERDYAKKIVLDIEHETLQLRNAYSRELLALEDAKVRAREEAAEKAGGRVAAMQRELADRNNLLKRFEEMLEDREEKIRALSARIEKAAARGAGKKGQGAKKAIGKRAKKGKK
ncbi:MAG: hypothetical protein V1676_00180 [Candidatus Diapherotrites archaeon]